MSKFTYFWKSDSPFSNWYMANFSVNNIVYNCSEQYMMYKKAELFGDKEAMEKILKSKSPRDQKAEGRKVKNFDTVIWESKCKQIVYEACKAKFQQNSQLLKMLMATEGTELVEASPYDNIWGIGLSEDDPRAKNKSTWQGKNWLGEVLTKLRNDIKEQNNI